MTVVDKPTELQALLVIVVAFVFLVGLAGSIAAWFWALGHFEGIRRWTGWDRDRPQTVIGIVDLVACFFAMVFAQTLVLYSITLVVGRDAVFPNRTKAPAEEISVLPASFAPDPSQENVINSALELTSQLKTQSETQLQTQLETQLGTELRTESGSESEDKTDQKEASDDTEPTIAPWITPILTMSFLLGGIISVGLVLIRTGARPAQIGLSLQRFGTDVLIGGMVFLMMTPVLMIVSSIAISITDVEYQHPVMDAMAKEPWTYPLLFIGAVICAPIWEEYVFRGLLIGWLDSIRSSGGRWWVILLGCTGRVPKHFESGSFGAGRFSTDNLGELNLDENRLSVDAAAVSDDDRDAVAESDNRYPPWWPAILSGLLFGLAHFEYGVSWIPLVVFGTVVGRLYQLRRSIVPCVVVHALFNGMSMLGLAMQLMDQQN